MQSIIRYCVFFLLIQNFIRADLITVSNQTEQDLYVAVYYEKNNRAEQNTAPALVVAGAEVRIERPSRKFMYDRELYVSDKSSELQKILDEKNTARLLSVNIGDLEGSNFYVAEQDGKRIAFALSLSASINKQITDQFRAIRTNPYKNKVARVRLGNELSEQEKAYLQKRLPKVKKAVEKLIGETVDEKAVPKIALVESGGGYRAMASSIGFHKGLADAGIMDVVSYMVGLSGSTWSIGLWTRSSLPIDKFQEQLFIKMENDITAIDTDGLSMIGTNFLVKKMNRQDLTLVDIFGGLLANTLLSGTVTERQRIYMSEQAKIIDYASMPLPIYTAVRGDGASEQYWFEFTPYEVGSTWLGAYVPTWAFGRQFANGKSVDFAPEQSMGYLLGTFGSAFSGTINQFADKLKLKTNKLPAMFKKLFDEIGESRITTARVFNYTSGIPGAPFEKNAILNLVDAGLECNLPYQPVSGERAERAADIMIIMDASASVLQKPGAELKKIEAYVRQKNLKFPTINYTDIEIRAVSIFKDESDAKTPLVIYMPLVNDLQLRNAVKKGSDTKMGYFAQTLTDFDVQLCISKLYCSTFNFKYQKAEAMQLSGLMEFNVVASKDTIVEAIKWKIAQMKNVRE